MKRIVDPFLVAFWAISPSVAWAQANTEHEGMPQLNFASPLTTSQVVWMAVIFLALYLLLARWALPQVAAVLDDRAARINADLDAARAAKSEVDAATAEVRRATRQAQADAQAHINAAVSEAKAASAAQAVEANARLDARLATAEAQISAARAAAMGALRQVASETTEVLIDRLTGAVADRERVNDVVSSVIATRRA